MNKKLCRSPLCISMAVIIGILIAACTTDYVTGKRTFSLVSESQEIAMGKEADPQIIAEYGLYDDPGLTTEVQNLGKHLAAVSQRSELQYNFRVLDSPVVNAFALPGGYVYVTRGILAYFNSEDELAGVLGHEIGHVVARHSAEQMSRVQLASLGLGLGSLVSEQFRKFANVAETGLGLLFLSFSRGQETEADMLGVEYSSKLGYDAHKMAGFFGVLKKMSAESGQSLPSFLSTHPDPGNREVKVNELTNEWQSKPDYKPLKTSRYTYLKLIDGIVFGDDPRQGYVDDHVFYHPLMKFQFPVPSGWNVANTPSTVQLVNADKKAALQLTLGKSASLDSEADDFVTANKVTVQKREHASVHGYSALAVESSIKNDSESISILSYFISKDGNVFVFHGYTSSDLYDQYRAVFLNAMRGFDQVRDAAVLEKKPVRIHVKQAPRSGNLANVLASLGVPEARQSELALVNGMSVNDQVKQGEWIKVVGE
jgi:predicted Zn-dependent protease